MVTGQSTLPLKLEITAGEYRELQFTKAATSVGASVEQENLNYSWWIVGSSMWTTLIGKKSLGGPSPEGGHIFVSFSSSLSTRFLQWILEKNLHMLPAGGEGKEPFCIISEHFIHPNKILPHQKLFNPSLTCLGFFSEPNWLGGKEISYSSPL